jgi:WD40 repeat protein
MANWRFSATLAYVALGVGGCFSWAADTPVEQVPVRIFALNKFTGTEKIPVISSVAVDSTGKLLATVGDDHLLRIWNLEDGAVLYRLAQHSDWIKAVCFRPDGKALATAGDDRRIRIWNLTAAGQPLELPEQPQAIHALAYSPEGKIIASAGFDDKVRLYTADGRLPREFDGPGSDLSALAFSPDGSQLAVAGRSGTIRVWNAATGAKLADIQASRRRICALTYSPGGGQLAAAGYDRIVRLFNPASGKTLATLPEKPGKITALCFCGEKLLAAGSTDNNIRLWNLNDNTQQNQLLGHTGAVSALAYNPQTGTLFSGSFDTTVRAWRIANHYEGISQR